MVGLPSALEVRIRPAQRMDLPAVVALRRTVGWGSGGLEGSFLAADAGRQAILVADLDGALVGAVTVAFQSGAPPTRGHVSDLLVSPLWRRRGVGTQLLQAAEQAAQARGVHDCTLDVDAHNAVALALYRRSGYGPYRPAQFPWGPGVTLRKEIGPRPAPRAPGLLARWRWRLR